VAERGHLEEKDEARQAFDGKGKQADRETYTKK
jgi:hypothetical protein